MLFYKRYYQGPLSDHFDGKCFFNPWNKKEHSWLDAIKWKFTSSSKKWPQERTLIQTDKPPSCVEGSPLRASFVGHSTFLIQTQGINLLTDPIWSTSAGPFKSSMTRRMNDPGIIFEDLPKIDIVLVSHNHFDHLDKKTLKRLFQKDNPLFITPLGNDKILKSIDSSLKVHTLDWQQSIFINQDVSIHLQPTQHWSGRSLWDRDQALWGAFVIKTSSGNLYFAGDTGYGKGEIFRQAKVQFGSFRLACLPIGAYEPRWLMQYPHMNPEEAVMAHLDLGSPYTIGMHFGTFRLTDEGFETPLLDLAEARKKHHVLESEFVASRAGSYWFIP